MTCSSYWARIVRTTITPRYPGVVIVQARAYAVPRTIEHRGGRLELPGVIQSDDDPIKAMKKWLATNYGPGRDIVLMFHPRGGFVYHIGK